MKVSYQIYHRSERKPKKGARILFWDGAYWTLGTWTGHTIETQTQSIYGIPSYWALIPPPIRGDEDYVQTDEDDPQIYNLESI